MFAPDIISWPLTLPEEAAALIERRVVRAYGLRAHIPSQGGATWDLGVEVAFSDNPSTWVSNWQIMKNMGVAGLGDALASLYQAPIMNSADATYIWGRDRRNRLGDARVHIGLCKYGAWMGLLSPLPSRVKTEGRLLQKDESGEAMRSRAVLRLKSSGLIMSDVLTLMAPPAGSGHKLLASVHNIQAVVEILNTTRPLFLRKMFSAGLIQAPDEKIIIDTLSGDPEY